jgi:ATP-dependent protease ClpP protease subunit
MPVQMRAATGGAPATLTLMGDVGFDITASGVATALKGLADDAPLTVSLNSYGGDALAGIAIHNMLARRQRKPTMIVEGIAASAASLIAMAGERIVMPSNAFLMIHEAWGAAVGDADTMRGQAEVLEQISGAYRRTYAARTGLEEQEVAAMMAAETWLDAETAVAKGFATEAAEPAAVKAFAALPLSRFTRVPAPLAALVANASTPPAGPPAPDKEMGSMPDDITPAGGLPAPQASTPTPHQPAPVLASDVVAIAERNGLGLDFVRAQLDRGATREQALEAALDAVAAAGPRPAATPGLRVTRDGFETARARIGGAFASGLLAAAQGRVASYSAEEREFAGISMLGMARELMAQRGERGVHRLSNADLVPLVLAYGTHTASDFAGVLANTFNKTVRELYGAYPDTWSSWTDQVEVDDFKTITAASIGQVSEVQPVQDGGQVIYGTIAEDPAETYSVSERGVILPVGRQALVNDDTRALTRAAQALSLGAYTGLRRTVFGVLTTNANMADGVAFLVLTSGAGVRGYGNLIAASALDAAALRLLRAQLQNMTGPARAGRPVPSMPPVQNTVLLVPPTREITAQELTSPLIVPNAVGAALPQTFRQSIEVVTEPFLQTGNAPFYMARTEAGMRAVEIAFLRGRRTPEVTDAERIDYTGITFRCLFDFGAKSVTPRTIAGNLGA